jgi:RHS repeat-associated protein
MTSGTAAGGLPRSLALVRTALVAALCVVVGSLAVWAKGGGSGDSTSAVNSKGYDRGSAYLKIDGPDINAFNLNFVVQFPLAVGLNYPENAGVGLQLNLTYDSHVVYEQKRGRKRFVRVRRQNPFGLGFDLTLGKIVGHPSHDYLSLAHTARLLYVDSSGASHSLAYFQTTTAGDEWRTHDGSHIRAIWAGGLWTVNFPNGVVQELGHYVSNLAHYPTIAARSDLHWGDTPADNSSRDLCDDTEQDAPAACADTYFIPDPIPNPTTAMNGFDWDGFDRDFVGWHVTRVSSLAGASGTPPSYTVEYFGDGGDTANARFAHVIRFIRDQHGRTIEFVIDTSNGTVSSILTPSPGNEAGSLPPAEYRLDYRTVTVGGIAGSTGVKVLALAHLWSPNVAPAGTQNYVHTFDYAPASTAGNYGGQLSRIDYPSGKTTVIAFHRYSYLNGSPGYCNGQGSTRGDPDECNAGTNGGTCAWSWGVSQVETFLDGNTSNLASSNHLTTSFTQNHTNWTFYNNGTTSCDANNNGPGGYQRWDQVHTMIDSAGNQTELRYRTPKEDDDEGLQQWYGLLISEKYYGGNGANAKLLKQVDYTYKKLDMFEWTAKDREFEMVPERIRTTWLDDENEAGGALGYATAMNEDRSEFDNFGHFQRVEYSGNAVGGETKVVIKDYAADNPEASCDAEDLKGNWLGDVVAREEVRKKVAGGQTVLSRLIYGFDATRGVRTRAIQKASVPLDPPLCDAAPTAVQGDVATDYSFTSMGDLESERRYLTSPEAGSAPTDVTTNYTYQYGAVQSVKNSALSFYDFVRIIDRDSALTLEERKSPTSLTDATADTTKFEYDVLGRTTKIAHGTDDPVTLAYENEPETSFATEPPPAQNAVRLARIRSTQGVGASQIEAVDHFTLGRFDHEEKLNPDGTRAFRYVSYNAAGRKSFVTEWTRQPSGTGVPGTLTEYDVSNGANPSYEEPFGRPTRVTDPLGGKTTYRYFGTNKEVTSLGVALKATALDDPGDVRTRYFTDALGRLRFVSKPTVVGPGAGHGPYETSGTAAKYTFDVMGRMLQADLSAAAAVAPLADNTDRFNATVPDSQNARQQRFFSYDALGRLTTSTTPEEGTKTNERFNALGDVTQSRDGNGADYGYALRTTFDAAGRPTRLEKIADSGQTMNQSFTPDSAGWTMSADWRVDSPGDCLKENLVPVKSWYLGDGTCRYAQGASGIQSATLTSPAITLTRGPILSFRYFREVHGDAPGTTPGDVLRVEVRDTSITPVTWEPVFSIDSTQVSWSRWMWSPPLNLSKYITAMGTVQIRFVFDSGGQNLEETLHGIGISQVVVRQPAATTLQESTYDVGTNGLGKLTKIQEYDEVTQAPIFTRELHYADPNGRLSDEVLSFDWDRNGTDSVLVDQYDYDSRGELASQWMPHPVGTSARRYDYSRVRGALVGVTATDPSGLIQNFIPNLSSPGIEYDDSGSMKIVRYGNGTQLSIEANAASLPQRIHVSGPSGAELYSTGIYSYDGARNIKQIGSDYYRYDADSRLTWARVTSSQYGTVDLDQAYDEYGNMTAQSASSYPPGSTPVLPAGMAFSGRSYADYTGKNSNRLTYGTVYDAAGNLTFEAGHDGLPSQGYEFSAQERLTRVTDGGGKTYQEALYEGEGHRWFRSVAAEGGTALITLRDASGAVVADFSETTATSGLKLEKEYVRANGQIVAINSTCGPRPLLALSNPAKVGVDVWFDKTTYDVQAVGSYTIFIRTDDGRSKTIIKPSDLANHFSLPEADLFPNATNYITIEITAACGRTGYSNAAVYAYDPQAGGLCVNSMSSYRSNFTSTGSSLRAGAIAACPTGTKYNVYFLANGDDAIYPLNGASPTGAPWKLLSNIPCGSGEGRYWVAPVDPVSHMEVGDSPSVQVDSTSCGGSLDHTSPGIVATPGQPSMNAQYLAWDHLGSTRLVTDEQGVVIASSKFYPFGYEAESTGGAVRQKFTGHERDERVGLDYMMARDYRMALGRFLEPDPYDGSVSLTMPQSWNRYAYVFNDPINAADPSGHMLQRVVSGSPLLGVSFLYGSSSGSAQPDNAPGETTESKSVSTAYVPAPASVMGTCEYYSWRYENAPASYRSGSGPEYYLDFGLKFCEGFTAEAASPQASAVERQFIAQTRLGLQDAHEKQLKANPSIGLSREAVFKAAVSTHGDAYRQGGWGRLTCGEQWRVAGAIGSAWSTPGVAREAIRSADLGLKCFIVPALLLLRPLALIP